MGRAPFGWLDQSLCDAYGLVLPAAAFGRTISVAVCRQWVVSARSPLWNAAVEVVDVEAGDRGLLDDPRTSSFRGRAVRRARKL